MRVGHHQRASHFHANTIRKPNPHSSLHDLCTSLSQESPTQESLALINHITTTSDIMADIDMDVDMDIDLGLDPEIAQLEAEAMKIVRQPIAPSRDTR